MPGYTFAKLPVHALITDLKQFDPKKVSLVKNPHLAMWPTSLSRPKYFGTYPNLPVHAQFMTHKKKTYGHQLGPMTHFLTTPKFDLLLYIGEKCAKTPIFITFSGKKRSNWKKSKELLRASTVDHDLFLQMSHIWPTFIFGASNAPDTFF